LHNPFNQLRIYSLRAAQPLNKFSNSEELELIFCTPAEHFTDKHRAMLIKMANDIQLYVDSRSMIQLLYPTLDFSWQDLQIFSHSLKVVFFGPGLHSLSDSIPNVWHVLDNHQFLNTDTLEELADDKIKAMNFWKAFKPVFKEN